MRPTNEFSVDFDQGEFDPLTVTTFDAVKVWLGNPKIEDQVIAEAWLAAERYVDERTDWDKTQTPPDDLVLAVDLLTARYLARRNSPDGIVGLGDLGPAQVMYTDADVERLLNPWRFFPVA